MSRQIDFDILVAEHAEVWHGQLAAIENLIYIDNDEAPEQHTAFADRLLHACSLYESLVLALIGENTSLFRERLRNGHF